MTRRIFLLAVAVALAFGAHAQDRASPQKSVKGQESAKKGPAAQEAAAGSTKHGVNVAMCIGCHGLPGYKTAYPEVYHVPKIAGQQPAYLEAALKAYRAGQRPHPSMRGIAGNMSDEEISALAQYYGGTGK